jgi:hypothetical protein
MMCKYCKKLCCEKCIKKWLEYHDYCKKCKAKITKQDFIYIPLINDKACFFVRDEKVEKNDVNNAVNVEKNDDCHIHNCKVEYYCVECDKHLCPKCLIIFGNESQLHRNHYIIDIKKKELADIIDKVIKPLNKKLLKVKKDYNEEKNKTKELKEKIVNNSFDNINLMKEINEKEKELKEYKSRFPFQLLEGEKIISVIFFSIDEKINFSVICKNNEKFFNIENKLYMKYPELIDNENDFLIKGKKVNRFKNLEENNINNLLLFKILNY